MKRTRIGIVGDFNPGYISHRETGIAVEDSGQRLGIAVDYQWVATDAVASDELDWTVPGMGLLRPSTDCGQRPARPIAASTARWRGFASRASGACRSSAPEGASNILC